MLKQFDVIHIDYKEDSYLVVHYGDEFDYVEIADIEVDIFDVLAQFKNFHPNTHIIAFIDLNKQKFGAIACDEPLVYKGEIETKKDRENV